MEHAGKPRLLAVSPCRDEAAYLEKSIRSVLAQSRRPDQWVIVDDGSTDGTHAILKQFEQDHSFITVVRREDRGERRVGPGVVDAFYEGLNAVDWKAYDYLCKLDLDLVLPKQYFERLLERMERNPRLGTCSGKAYFRNPRGKLLSEKCGDEMSQGMTKLYRTACFEEIGGFVRQVMWDGIDCHRCRMKGWQAASWDDPELRFVHLRPMGSSQQGIFTGRMRHGYGQYFMGTGPFYMLVSSLYRMTRPPYIVGGLGMWIGYMKALLTRQKRYEDPEFRRFLRSYQWSCLLHGKKRATEKLDARQRPVWLERNAKDPIHHRDQ